ncbi:MAG: hypothetical protein E6G04_10350 [Actinobacteria bacterium]|nr:MAG: hypothetical protein E6G04_10350 [Actinomycetota bacterium]
MAEADTFEAWADVARHYLLNPDWTDVSGYSMGGFGTYRLLARYPDLFARGFSTVGIPGAVDPQIAALRNTPIMAWNDVGDELVRIDQSEAAEQRLAAAGLRFTEWLFVASDHLTLATNDEYGPAASFLGTALVNRNPAHVTYVVQPSQDAGSYSVVANHAYWLSNVLVRNASVSTGTADVRSEGFGFADPSALGVKQGVGALMGGNHGPMPYISREQDWGPAQTTPVRDELDIIATNISTLTIDPQRARVDCSVRFHVTTDGPLTVIVTGCGTYHF